MVDIFYDYKPSEKTKDFIDKELKKICNLAPYNSFICGCMERSWGKYKLTVNINSYKGIFNAMGEHSTERVALKQVKESIKKQFKKWHVERFSNSSERNTQWVSRKYCKNSNPKCFSRYCPIQNKSLAEDMAMQSVVEYQI